MRVIVLSKTTFDVVQHNAVTNIAYSSGNYVITDNGNTYTYAAAGHIINILT